MAKKKSIKLLGSRLVVEPIKPDVKSKGGVFLPGTMQEGSFKKAIVRVLGQGTKMDDGSFEKPIVVVGDHVLLPSKVGVRLDLNGEDLLLVNESDVIGVLK